MTFDDLKSFSYRARCVEPGCQGEAVYKIAAPWSDGTSRELKNYGLACEAHAPALLEHAQQRRDSLKTSEGEAVGRVGLYGLLPGSRDGELRPLEPGSSEQIATFRDFPPVGS